MGLVAQNPDEPNRPETTETKTRPCRTCGRISRIPADRDGFCPRCWTAVYVDGAEIVGHELSADAPAASD